MPLKTLSLREIPFFLTLSAIFFNLIFVSYVLAFVGNVEEGKKVYYFRCAGCHGMKGEGDGVGAAFLYPPPRNFAAGIFKYKSTKGEGMPSDDDLFKTITNGLPGTPMPRWGDILSENNKWNVIAFIKTFAKGRFEKYKTEIIDYSGQIPSSQESIAMGKDLFLGKAGCYRCHGYEARGDGRRVVKDVVYSKRLWPRNLTQPWTFRAGSDVKDIFTRITVGIPAATMPSHVTGQHALNKEERWHVANYIVSVADLRKKVREGEDILRGTYVELIPKEVSDPIWDATKGLVVPMSRQIPGEKFMFTPTNLTMVIKSLFDNEKIAFLLEWDDRNPSIVGDEEILKLSLEEKLYNDAVAIQLPQVIPESSDEPNYFGHGSTEMPTNVLYWGAGTTNNRDILSMFNANGLDKNFIKLGAEKAVLTGSSEYYKGTWKVLMTRDLATVDSYGTQFKEGKLIPITFANWDGSNLETGSKHTVTTWHWMILGHTLKAKKILFNTLSSYLLLGKFGPQDSVKYKEANELWQHSLSMWTSKDIEKVQKLILWADKRM